MDQTIITCPSCSRRYAVKANAITSAGRKVRCAGCGHVWVALPDTPAAASLEGGAGGTSSDTPTPPPPPPVRATWQGGRPEVSAAPAVEKPAVEPPAGSSKPEEPGAAEPKPVTPFPGTLGTRPLGETKPRPPIGPRPGAAAQPGAAPVPGNFTSLGGVAGAGPRPAGAPYMPRMDTPRRPSGEWADVTAERVDPRTLGPAGESVRPAAATHFSEPHLSEPVSFDLDEKPKKRRTALKVLLWLVVLFLAAAALVFILIQSGVLREAFPSLLDRPLPGLGQAAPGDGATGPAGSDAGASLPAPSTTSSTTGPASGAAGSSAPASVIPGGVMPGAFPPAGASGAANPSAVDTPSSGPAAPDVVPSTPAN
ncbi:MAG: zinc-ribbon domain-containing protein [Parvibaculaceae bacterium]|nr:zinc-ribbon domain-containing protein [Parvibaculaceae bacterium]